MNDNPTDDMRPEYDLKSLMVVSRGRYAKGYDAARHRLYLHQLATNGTVPPAVATKARLVWEAARRAVPDLAVPAAVAYDGGPIHYTWDDRRHVVTAEVHETRPCEWYVSDRETGIFGGGDFEPARLPEAFIAELSALRFAP